jgi:tagatose 1,6-diphosphate aldolase GatY/KbaY
MLVAFRDVLTERRKARAAAGAFTCYDVTTALGVVRAAERRSAPVILLVGEASFAGEEGRLLVPALAAVAESAEVPACVQIDHVADSSLLDAALASRAHAVLADGSRLPLDENIALVRRAVDSAPAGVGVEAELGHIEGGEDVAAAVAAGALTDPDQAAELARATGADCLAVSIGNVHGTYAAYPELDWARLRRIRTRVDDLPLSLHGASGLEAEDLRRAIELGICKVNVNTELRRRYLAELNGRLPDALPGLRVLDLQQALIEAVAGAAGEILDVLAKGRERRRSAG